LTGLAHGLAQSAYQQEASSGTGGDDNSTHGASNTVDDDVVDAEFQEVA